MERSQPLNSLGVCEQRWRVSVEADGPHCAVGSLTPTSTTGGSFRQQHILIDRGRSRLEPEALDQVIQVRRFANQRQPAPMATPDGTITRLR